MRSSPSGGSLDGTRTPDRAARYVLGFSSSGSLAIALATLRASSLVRYSGIIGTPMVVLAVDIGEVVIVAVVDPIAPGVSVTVHGGVETAPSRWTPVGIGKDGNLATGPSLPALP